MRIDIIITIINSEVIKLSLIWTPLAVVPAVHCKDSEVSIYSNVVLILVAIKQWMPK